MVYSDGLTPDDMHGFEFSHETVRLWKEKCAPPITEHLRKTRTGLYPSGLQIDFVKFMMNLETTVNQLN